MTSTAYPLAATVAAHPADAVMVVALSYGAPALSCSVVAAYGDADRPHGHGIREAFTVRPASPLTDPPAAPVRIALRPGWGLVILTDGPGTITADHVDPDGIVVATITAAGPILAEPWTRPAPDAADLNTAAGRLAAARV